MPLCALPTVLVQSCMQFLAARDLLVLSRCSRWLTNCADSAFAWRDCAPIALDVPGARAPPSSRLLHLIPTALTWHRQDGRPEADDAALQQLLSLSSVTRAVELRVCTVALNRFDSSGLPANVVTQLLTAPSMQRIRVLLMPEQEHTIALATTLPQLRTMHFVPIYLRPYFETEWKDNYCKGCPANPAVLNPDEPSVRIWRLDSPSLPSSSSSSSSNSAGGAPDATASPWSALDIGGILDVRDTFGTWIEAQVRGIKPGCIFIHYLGWKDGWDEWIDTMGSHVRLAERNLLTTPRRYAHYAEGESEEE